MRSSLSAILALLAFGLVQLVDQGGKGIAPAIHRFLGMANGDGPGLLDILLVQVEIGRTVVVLESRGHLVRIDLRKGGQGFLDAILQQQIIDLRQLVIIVELPAIGEQFEEAVILLQKRALTICRRLTQRMGSGIDQRAIFQMLVLVTGHRIDDQQRTDQRPAALGHQVIGVQQELLSGRDVGMEEGIGPQGGIVEVPALQKSDHTA